jgi:MFS family permease
VDASTEAQSSSIMKLALMALAGATIEWYDFFLYGFASALVFPALFFPKTLPHAVALVASFSTFAVGFVARPIGALLFGHIGDRIGRKSALAIALVLMGIGTTLIACLPTYATLGVLAPVLLVVLRFAQGLAIGGQWGGAILLVVESAPRNQRGFYGSFAQAGVPTGVVCAIGAFLLAGALTSSEDFAAWGWRLPFLASVFLIGLGLYIHYRVEETPVYRELMRKSAAARAPGQRSPIVQVVRDYPREIVRAAGAFIATNICFYIAITWVVAFGTDADGLHIARATMLTAVGIASAVMAPLLLIAGTLSDRFGRRRIYMLGAVLTVAAAFAMFPLIESRELLWITVGIGTVLGATSFMYGPQAALFGEMFRTEVRYSGASLGYQLGAIVGGGLAPLIATGLMTRFNTTLSVSSYMAAACVVSFLCVGAMRETSCGSLNEDGS